MGDTYNVHWHRVDWEVSLAENIHPARAIIIKPTWMVSRINWDLIWETSDQSELILNHFKLIIRLRHAAMYMPCSSVVTSECFFSTR